MSLSMIRCITLSCLVGGAVTANAAAVYSTSAASSFGVDAPSGTTVLRTFGGTLDVAGAVAVAGYDGVASGSGSKPVTKSMEVDGSADAMPAAFATSTFMVGHVIHIDNKTPPGGTAEKLIVSFRFEYSWDTSVSADDPSLEAATSGAFFGISGFEPGIDSIDIDGDGLGPLTDTFGTSAYLFNPNSSTTLGEAGTSGTSLVTGFIIIEAGEEGTFSVITDVTGRAFARLEVPEPGTPLTVMLGLLAAGVCRRRPSAPKLR